MRRVWVESLVPGEIELAPTEARHVRDVLRVRIGDALVLFDGDGRERPARVGSASKRGVRVRTAGPIAPGRPAVGPEVTLVVALLKGEAMDRVVRSAAELGVVAVRPVIAARSVPRPRQERASRQLARWRRIAREAARQSGRARVPRVECVAALDEAVRGLPAGGRRILLWEGERDRALGADRGPDRAYVLAVGPEGGWTSEEVGSLRAAGFEPRSLSDSVLRADTAAIAAVAIARGASAGRGERAVDDS